MKLNKCITLVIIMLILGGIFSSCSGGKIDETTSSTNKAEPVDYSGVYELFEDEKDRATAIKICEAIFSLNDTCSKYQIYNKIEAEDVVDLPTSGVDAYKFILEDGFTVEVYAFITFSVCKDDKIIVLDKERHVVFIDEKQNRTGDDSKPLKKSEKALNNGRKMI